VWRTAKSQKLFRDSNQFPGADRDVGLIFSKAKLAVKRSGRDCSCWLHSDISQSAVVDQTGAAGDRNVSRVSAH